MILPTTYMTALLLTVAAMVCWGSWPSTYRLTGRWRFELYYYDFALGVLIVTTLATFTLGTLGADITSLDNLTIVRKRQLVYALSAGAVFNLANMLFTGALSITGMAVAFPMTLGAGLASAVGWTYWMRPEGSPAMLFTGAAVVLVAAVSAAATYSRHIAFRNREIADAVAAGTKRKLTKRGPAKGIVVSLISGVILGSVLPLMQYARSGGEIEMGPYPIALLFGVGVFGTTLLFNLYFLNLPIQGEAISMLEYFQGTWKQHLAGIAGGAIWAAGGVCCLIAAAAPAESGFRSEAAYTMGMGAAIVGLLWALLYWKEFSGSSRLRIMIWATAGVLAAGFALVSTTLFAARN